MNHGNMYMILHLQDCHILNENGTDASFLQFQQKSADSVEFVIIDNGIQRHIHLDTKRTGIPT